MPVSLPPVPGLALQAQSQPWTAWPRLAPTWAELARGRTMFLLAESVSAWLDTFGPRLQPEIVLFHESVRGTVPDADAVVGAAILVRRRRLGITRVYLHTAGEDVRDSACLEFNELVCRPGREPDVARALRAHLGRWDVLHVPWMADGPSRSALESVFGEPDSVLRSTDFYVDLARIRSGLDVLNAQDRHKHRKSLRRFGALGPLQLDAARTPDEAKAHLRELARLHQRTWTARGEPGSFASAAFAAYHARLIDHAFPLGRIQLLRLRAGDTTIGYHYNFVVDGKVWFYQCGYDYDRVAGTRPGATMHTLAIQHALDAGLAEYDFMAGVSDHKRRLSNASRPVASLTWHGPSWRMRLVGQLRRVRRKLDRLRHEPPLGVVLTDLYTRTADNRRPLGLPPDPEVRIRPIAMSELSIMAAVQTLGDAERAQRIARGDRCYGAWVDGELAHFIWLQFQGTHRVARAGRDVDIAPGECWLYNAYTSPAYRGRHVMPRTLQQIVDDLFDAGYRTVRLYVSRDNTASHRGVLRTHFAVTGTLRALRVGRRFLALREAAGT